MSQQQADTVSSQSMSNGRVVASSDVQHLADVKEKYAKDHADELSVGAYARKKGYEITVLFGSALVGVLAGVGAARKWPSLPAKFIGGNLERLSKLTSNPEIFAKYLEDKGYGALKDCFTESGVNKEQLIHALEHDPKAQQFGQAAGGVLGWIKGTTIGGAFTAYEHWVKVESSRRSIQEMNEDVSRLKLRDRAAPEVIEENQRLRGMLKEEHQRTRALEEKIEEIVPKSQVKASQGMVLGTVSSSDIVSGHVVTG